MKHVIIEGWRGINHSIAMVNQYQLIELLKMDNLSIYHRDLPYLNLSWNMTDNDSGLPSAVKEQINSIPPPEWGWYDCVYCTQSRHDRPRPLADRVITFLITEFGFNISTDKKEYVESICYGENLVVSPSNWVTAKLVEFGFSSDKIQLVPLGVNPHIFFPSPLEERNILRSQLNASPEHFVFLNVGAMTWNKGIDLLLRSFAEVRKVHSNARLVLKDNSKLYGFGADNVVQKVYADFPQLMTEEVRSSIVLIKSTLTIPQMRLLYGSADAYVSPYRAEGFNLPVIEAIACGTPVIVTAGGSTDDFCDNDTASFVISDRVDNRVKLIDRAGFHLEPDIEHLVHQMKTAITDRTREKSSFEDGRSHLISNYSWEAGTKKLVSFFTR